MPNRNTPITDRQLLLELWEHSPIGLALVDKSGLFLSANPCFCELLGYAETELLDGGKFDFYSTIHPSDRRAATQAGERLAGDAREGFGMECTQIRKTGGTTRVLLSARALRRQDAGGGHQFAAMLVTTQPLDDRSMRLEEAGGDVHLRFADSALDLWRIHKKSCILGGVIIFALVKSISLESFFTIVNKFKEVFQLAP